jgi:signal peptidase I
VIVSGESMEPALEAGDLVVTVRKRGYDVGDVIAYRIPDGEPGAGVLVIHRIVGGSAGAGYITQGDNREGRDPWRPRPHDVVGTEAVSVPRVGLGLAHVRTPLGLAVLAGVVTGLLVLGGSNTTGRSEHAGAKESPQARLRRRRRHERADDVDDVPPPGSPAGDSAAPEIPAAAATGRQEGETRALAGAVATVALLVAVTVVTHRRLRLVE